MWRVIIQRTGSCVERRLRRAKMYQGTLPVGSECREHACFVYIDRWVGYHMMFGPWAAETIRMRVQFPFHLIYQILWGIDTSWKMLFGFHFIQQTSTVSRADLFCNRTGVVPKILPAISKSISRFRSWYLAGNTDSTGAKRQEKIGFWAIPS